MCQLEWWFLPWYHINSHEICKKRWRTSICFVHLYEGIRGDCSMLLSHLIEWGLEPRQQVSQKFYTSWLHHFHSNMRCHVATTNLWVMWQHDSKESVSNSGRGGDSSRHGALWKCFVFAHFVALGYQISHLCEWMYVVCVVVVACRHQRCGERVLVD